MKILITGMAGFIGFHLSRRMAERGDTVFGIDNMNTYYDPKLKQARLAALGIGDVKGNEGRPVGSSKYPNLRFAVMDLTDRERLDALFADEKFDVVCNLAAQAGVRYSLENPHAYVQSNVVGFVNLLEACRNHHIRHLVYASSSSVYGKNTRTPYAETDRTDHPESLYAATKKSNELMAYVYGRLYGLPTTGLRFFTVYGPFGRPDMAPFLFMDAIRSGRPIRVFNHGEMMRDFTYIDDVVRGVMLVIDKTPCGTPAKIYNIGNSDPVALLDFIAAIENAVGKKAIRQYEKMQAGDVPCTYADTSRLEKDFGFHPHTPLQEGITRFHEWFESYYAS